MTFFGLQESPYQVAVVDLDLAGGDKTAESRVADDAALLDERFHAGASRRFTTSALFRIIVPDVEGVSLSPPTMPCPAPACAA